LKENKEIS